MGDWRELIRDIPDFPLPGIMFKDIAPVLADSAALAAMVGELVEVCRSFRPDAVVAVEARGFLLGSPVALALGVGLVPVRKPGKLPYLTRSVSYALEYGEAVLHMHVDALATGARVLLVDDVLATGGDNGGGGSTGPRRGRRSGRRGGASGDRGARRPEPIGRSTGPRIGQYLSGFAVAH